MEEDKDMRNIKGKKHLRKLIKGATTRDDRE
jgi:hypothetical protein